MSRDKLPQKVALTFKFLPLEDSKMATTDPLICSLYKKPQPLQKQWELQSFALAEKLILQGTEVTYKAQVLTVNYPGRTVTNSCN